VECPREMGQRETKEYVAKNGAQRGQRTEKDLCRNQVRRQEQSVVDDSCGSPMFRSRMMGLLNERKIMKLLIIQVSHITFTSSWAQIPSPESHSQTLSVYKLLIPRLSKVHGKKAYDTQLVSAENKNLSNTRCFIMYSGITKIYYRETVGHVFTKPVQIEGTQKLFSQ